LIVSMGSILMLQRFLSMMLSDWKFFTGVMRAQLVLVDFHLTVLLDSLCHYLAAIGLEDLISINFKLLAVFDGLFCCDGTPNSASWSILANCLRLEGLHKLSIFSQSLQIRLLQGCQRLV